MKLTAALVICILCTSALIVLPSSSSAGLGREVAFPYNDALVRPRSAASGPSPMAGAPPAPGYDDLSEYLMGTVAVGVVLPESDGTIDAETENWDAARQDEVRLEIETGLNWWTQQDLRARLSFTFEYHMSVPTGYEPINHAGPFDEGVWINDVMSKLGYTTGAYDARVVAWANYLRSSYRTDWAFVVFVVDSLNDADGRFTSGYCAYAYLGGPFFMMTYDNDGYGIGDMDYVAAHEMGHTFYATDEYNGFTEDSGYLNVADIESSGCIMHQALSWCISDGTLGQIGWRDSDGDDIFDILDEPPTTALNAYTPDPTNDTTPVYQGVVRVVPYPNSNPYGPGNDVTISRITNAQFAYDLTPWFAAQAVDGFYDSELEGYLFSTSPLASGIHIFYARAVNTEGNVDVNPPSDILTIDADKPYSALRSFPAIVNTSLFTLAGDASDNLGLQTVYLYYSYEGGAVQWLDADTAEPWEWSVYTVAMNGDGNYSFFTVAIDAVGNWEDVPAVADVNVLVDTLKPASTLDILPPFINESTFTLTARPVDSNGISSVDIWMDYESTGLQHLTTLSFPPWMYLVDASSTGDGHYSFYVGATDIAGNAELQHMLPDAATIVDMTPPVAALAALPQFTNMTRFDIVAAASDLNGISSVELWYRKNAGTWTLHSALLASPWRWDFDASAIGEGRYEFVSMAVDAAGNREAWPSSNETAVVVDVTPPTVSFTSPPSGVWINVSHVMVQWDGSDALSGIMEYRLQVGGSTWTISGSTDFRNLDYLPDGIRAAVLTAWDRAGNFNYALLTIKVDTSPPVLQFTSLSEGSVVESPAMIAWLGFDATSGIDRYEYSVDGGQFVAVGIESNATLDLSPGMHTFVLMGYDVAGNVRELPVSFSVPDYSVSGDLTVILMAILIVVVAATVIILLALKRRKKKEEDSPPPPPPPPR